MHPRQRSTRVRRLFVHALAAAGLVALAAAPAVAVTLDGLRGAGLEALYGQYAPAGDCRREPRVVVGPYGMDFTQGGHATHAARVEWATTYAGPDYDGIARWIFPFPLGDDDPGRVLMSFNPDEKPGTLAIEPNLGPGERMSALQAALVEASPYARCAG